jgi:hypothetical protein
MPRLVIPESYRPGLLKLAMLAREAADEVLDAIREQQPTLEEGKLASLVAARVRGVPESDVRAIIESLVSLGTALPTLSMSVTDIAESISSGSELQLEDQQRTILREMLAQMLALPAINVTGRAYSVVSESANLFMDVRILTDIRPVFLDGMINGPAAATIIHSLKITYQRDGRARDFYVVLDAEEIRTLRETLDRAEKKSASLREHVFQKAGLPYLELNRE